MPKYTNNTAETFVFPSLGVTVEPGGSFDTDAQITTSGVEVSGGKKSVNSVPAEPAGAAETPVEEVK